MQHKQVIFAEPRKRNLAPLIIDWLFAICSLASTVYCAYKSAMHFRDAEQLLKDVWIGYAACAISKLCVFIASVMLISGPISSRKSIAGTGVGVAGIMLTIMQCVITGLVMNYIVGLAVAPVLIYWGIVTYIMANPHGDFAQNMLPYPPYS